MMHKVQGFILTFFSFLSFPFQFFEAFFFFFLLRCVIFVFVFSSLFSVVLPRIGF